MLPKQNVLALSTSVFMLELRDIPRIFENTDVPLYKLSVPIKNLISSINFCDFVLFIIETLLCIIKDIDH